METAQPEGTEQLLWNSQGRKKGAARGRTGIGPSQGWAQMESFLLTLAAARSLTHIL